VIFGTAEQPFDALLLGRRSELPFGCCSLHQGTRR
jgi:hypothetical protein